MVAATREETKIFNLILTQDSQPISRIDKILGLELMGATCIVNCNKNQEMDFLKIAMEMRFSDRKEPTIYIPKAPIALTLNDDFISVFRFTLEVKTRGDKCSLL